MNIRRAGMHYLGRKTSLSSNSYWINKDIKDIIVHSKSPPIPATVAHHCWLSTSAKAFPVVCMTCCTQSSCRLIRSVKMYSKQNSILSLTWFQHYTLFWWLVMFLPIKLIHGCHIIHFLLKDSIMGEIWYAVHFIPWEASRFTGISSVFFAAAKIRLAKTLLRYDDSN